MLLVNSFDVEPWWATVPPCIGLDRWDQMPDRSEVPFRQYMDLCDEAGVKCTFFFVGWYARSFPERVREAVSRGHEVGCHSLVHEDVKDQSTRQFRTSTAEAKAIIEDAASVSVEAYRAPSFSFPVDRCAELLAELAAMGFKIDSSITTAGRAHGGGYKRDVFAGPRSMKDLYGVDIFEIPVPGVVFAGRELQVFGGGYLRLAPNALLGILSRREKYQVLYLHPHDLDSDLPPLPNRGYVNNLRRRISVGDVRKKVLNLLSASRVRSCGQIFLDYGGGNV